MRNVLVITNRRIKDDDVSEEKIISEASLTAAFREATKTEAEDGWIAVAVYAEYDDMSEAPANDGCGYKLIDNGEKRTLRRCRMAQGW